jgi:hypothetical protein
LSLQTHLPYLSAAEYATLTSVVNAAPADPSSAAIPLMRGDQTTESLVRKGFLVPDVSIDKVRVLHRLTAAAAATAPSFLAKRRHKLITEAFKKAGEPERVLLHLFAMPQPAAGEPMHEMLEYNVYGAVDPLVSAGVLTRPTVIPPYIATRRYPSTVTILLTSDALPLVENFLNARVVRTSVQLDMSLIRSSIAPGGGVGL